MKERNCALIIGILFLLVGIAGFIPGFNVLPVGSEPNIPVNAPSITIDSGYGSVFGLFPTNLLHNAVHIAVGILGIAAASSFSGARVFNQGFAIMYAAIALMGLFPFTNTVFGLMPIYGNNIWFNALSAAAAAYFSFFKPTEGATINPSPSV
jgi:Domain of unknown function (DUF4383)